MRRYVMFSLRRFLLEAKAAHYASRLSDKPSWRDALVCRDEAWVYRHHHHQAVAALSDLYARYEGRRRERLGVDRTLTPYAASASQPA